MEKYGDISVKKCDFIEVYPRFLVHNTKNLYKEKTGTRAGIWEQSVNILRKRHQTGNLKSSLSDNRPEAWELPFRIKSLWTSACFPWFKQREINYPPTSVGSPFSPERSCVLYAFLLPAFASLPFYKNAIRRIRPADWLCKSAPLASNL